MPREFYPDTCQPGELAEGENCGHEIEMFDGPGICTRRKGHPVDDFANPAKGGGQFHQEAFEGWVWNNKGRIG